MNKVEVVVAVRVKSVKMMSKTCVWCAACVYLCACVLLRGEIICRIILQEEVRRGFARR